MKKLLISLMLFGYNAYGAEPAPFNTYPDWHLMGSDKTSKTYRDDESSVIIQNEVGGWEKTIFSPPRMMATGTTIDTILSYTIYNCELKKYSIVIIGALYRDTVVLGPVESEIEWLDVESGSIRDVIGIEVCLPIKENNFKGGK